MVTGATIWAFRSLPFQSLIFKSLLEMGDGAGNLLTRATGTGVDENSLWWEQLQNRD